MITEISYTCTEKQRYNTMPTHHPLLAGGHLNQKMSHVGSMHSVTARISKIFPTAQPEATNLVPIFSTSIKRQRRRRQKSIITGNRSRLTDINAPAIFVGGRNTPSLD